MRHLALSAALASLLASAAPGFSAPTVGEGNLLPTRWSASQDGLASWTQVDFGDGLGTSAVVEVNGASDGSALGPWLAKGSIPGPLLSGIASHEFSVSEFEGRHRVRVVVEGAADSPMELGTLQLDRTPPSPALVEISADGRVGVARWSQTDPLSGTDPAAPIVAEINTSAEGDAAGGWIPFTEQPAPGDGRRVARTGLEGLAEGSHLARVRSRDRAGNEGEAALGSIVVDRTPPRVSDARLARPLTSPTALAEILFEFGDGSGTGTAGEQPRVGPVGTGDEMNWVVPGAPGAGHALVQLPGPGVFDVTVRLNDRAGNRGESAPLTIRVPTAAEAADMAVGALPVTSAGTGAAPGDGVAWAYRRVRRFHLARGVRLAARVGVATDASAWRRLLGVTSAARYAGYSTLRGRILLGPAATHGLEALGRLRAGRPAGPARRPSRADLDDAVLGLAVLLHESLHESGPVPRDDILGTRSGRALEEGLTEAATVDLLPGLVASLDLSPRMGARLAAAARRYRPAYRAELAWVRRASASATHSPAGSPGARAWRLRAADTWGGERWSRLAVVTSRDEASLRAEVAGLGGSGLLR